jgi:hypothetical protein
VSPRGLDCHAGVQARPDSIGEYTLYQGQCDGLESGGWLPVACEPHLGEFYQSCELVSHLRWQSSTMRCFQWDWTVNCSCTAQILSVIIHPTSQWQCNGVERWGQLPVVSGSITAVLIAVTKSLDLLSAAFDRAMRNTCLHWVSAPLMQQETRSGTFCMT